MRLDPGQIADFSDEPEPGYSHLCQQALQRCGAVLERIPPDRITPAMVDLALDSESVPRIQDIPESLRTPERCQKAFWRAPPINEAVEAEDCYPEHFLERWPALMVHRSRFFHWLAGLPEEQRTETLCAEFAGQFPDALHLIPPAILDKHPDWLATSRTPSWAAGSLHIAARSRLPLARCRSASLLPATQ